MPAFTIRAPFYPIVYVRGYAMTSSEREDTFHDAYYGFSANSVEKREASPENGYRIADIFEGQMIRFMKLRDYGYADSVNHGLRDFHDNPSRSIWVCRFYDEDFIQGKARAITDHARDLAKMITETIPRKLAEAGVVNLESDYKVILIAHSMGGLVCRTLIQNILPSLKSTSSLLPKDRINDPNSLIHRLVTIGTPHNGIDLGNIPNWFENSIVSALNPFNSSIFKPATMRKYLNLEPGEPVNSLGKSGFPIDKCLCVVGSDHQSYSLVKNLTGGHSDGLVKQNNAYVVEGGTLKHAYTANVHRAHSGVRGIVNSYESFENVQRFLFGDLKIVITLENVQMNTIVKPGSDYFYDFEFTLSIRGTGVYLHRREQDPCENAFRIEYSQVPPKIDLHTVFLNSSFNLDPIDAFSYFIMKVRVAEYRIEKNMLWDYKYPSREIYAESLEIKVRKDEAQNYQAGYRWLSDMDWVMLNTTTNSEFAIPLRNAPSVSGSLVLHASLWDAQK
ncbi:pimeloyl-ACP methyl ester carboxylesterase [Mucilaginibacter sp. UYP25]|uniref:esterase/lipase family protein n=1 Tax=unclassified Mucilaginibacter TaxID=2617802 RepID=UPI0033945ABE